VTTLERNAMLDALAPGPSAGTPLTGRQREVLALMAAGLTNQQIARRIHVTATTASTLVRRILAKLDVTNRAAAVNRGWELGLLGGAR